MRRDVISRLKSIFPSERLSTAAEDVVGASYDASRQEFAAEAVAWPLATEEVSAVMKLASAEGFAVYPRGAGSGMSGGALPVRGGLVLDFSKMNRLLEVRPGDRIAVCEPGIVLGDLEAQLKEQGLFFPPDPASHEFATLGGAVAENSGGLRAVKYGVTRDYVVGLEVVLPSGEVIQTGRKVLKSVVGYDLTRLFAGSEGTLGIFTKIAVRLMPLAGSVITLLGYFRGEEDAIKCAQGILGSRILPRALEFMDGPTLECVSQYRDFGIPQGVGAALLVELDGAGSAGSNEASRCEKIFSDHGALGLDRAESEEKRE